MNGKKKRNVLINHFKEIDLDYAKREYIWQVFKIDNTELLTELLFDYNILKMLNGYDRGLLQCYLVYLSSKKSITDTFLQPLIVSFQKRGGS